MPRALRVLSTFAMLAISVSVVIVGADALKTSDSPLLMNPWSIPVLASFLSIPVIAWTLFRLLDARWSAQPKDAASVIRFRQPVVARWFGWAGVVFLLGICAMAFKQSDGDLAEMMVPAVIAIVSSVALILSMRKPAAELVLSPAGLDYNRFGVGPIAWEEIQAAEVSSGSADSVRLTLRNPTRYRLPMAKKDGTLVIECSSVGAPAVAVLEAINLRRHVYSF